MPIKKQSRGRNIKTAIGINSNLTAHFLRPTLAGYKIIRFDQDSLDEIELVNKKRRLLEHHVGDLILITDKNYSSGIIAAELIDPHYLADKYRVYIGKTKQELDYRNMQEVGLPESIPKEVLEKLHSHSTDFQ